jgi:hypothetical protein
MTIHLWRSIVLALALVASVPVAAIERKPLPPVELIGLDGIRATNADLTRSGKWLMIYVHADCRPCNALLELIDRQETPLLPSKVVVVIGGMGVDDGNVLAQKFPDLVEASWNADPERAFLKVLQLPGAPVVLGMRDDVIEWSLAGALGKSADVQSVLRSWVAP